jgi:hypothetical protein
MRPRCSSPTAARPLSAVTTWYPASVKRRVITDRFVLFGSTTRIRDLLSMVGKLNENG